jgi:hypothetical protein
MKASVPKKHAKKMIDIPPKKKSGAYQSLSEFEVRSIYE